MHDDTRPASGSVRAGRHGHAAGDQRHTLRHSRWRRRLEFASLLLTIPAFYLAMLEELPLVARGLYALALAVTLAVVRHEWRIDRRHARRFPSAAQRLGLLVAAGLAASAVLPEGDGLVLIGVRLATAALIILRLGESLRPWFWRGGLLHLLAIAVVVLVLCGLGFWWLEPQARSFGDGLWLAFATAATVGYGDIVPTTAASKIFSAFVVLLGLSVLSMLTAAIAATWIENEDRRMEQSLLDELHRELRGLREELAALREEREAWRRDTGG